MIDTTGAHDAAGRAGTLVSPADGCVAVLAAVLVALSYPLLWGDRSPTSAAHPAGAVAAVFVHGEEHARLPLSAAAEITVEGRLGPTVIRVENGGARVVEDPGPQQLCVRVGEIRRPGQAAICLPNRVAVEIQGGERVYDAFNY